MGEGFINFYLILRFKIFFYLIIKIHDPILC